MKNSIRIKIARYMILFAVGVIGFIGLMTKFLLSDYYTDEQMKRISTFTQEVKTEYEQEDIEKITRTMENLRKEMGGELYYFNKQRGFIEYRKGKEIILNPFLRRGFIPKGEITEYIQKDKLGGDIYTFGVDVGEKYLVYEVSIEDLDRATDVILQFLWDLLIIVLALAVVVAMLLSNKISKPIQALNELANKMKSKEVEPCRVTKAEDEIGQLNQTLNELYEQLRSSIKQLEWQLEKERDAERVKKRFLAQATHELKTPLSVIRGYAEILYDGMYKDEEERERFIQNIYEESESVSHLILDVLAYTRMETGNEALIKTKIAAKDYYEKVIERYKGYILSKGLKLEMENLIPEAFVVEGDEKKIEQVLKNMMSNAVEHAKAIIKISLSQKGDKVKISIFNDGEPISEEDLPYIFDSFYKKKGKQKGTGLGLAIVKEIVLLHDGNYFVENQEEGVCFHLEL